MVGNWFEVTWLTQTLKKACPLSTPPSIVLGQPKTIISSAQNSRFPIKILVPPILIHCSIYTSACSYSIVPLSSVPDSLFMLYAVYLFACPVFSLVHCDWATTCVYIRNLPSASSHKFFNSRLYNYRGFTVSTYVCQRLTLQ